MGIKKNEAFEQNPKEFGLDIKKVGRGPRKVH